MRRAAFRPYIEVARTWDEAAERAQHIRRYAEGDYRIIELDGVPVGSMSVQFGPDRLDLFQIFILPEFQGRGIGTTCMRLFMREAQSDGIPVALQVLKVNPRARALYERLGFLFSGETETHHQYRWDPTP